MDRIDQKIDNKAEWLHNELRNMEGRICKTFDEKINNMDRNTDFKVQKAKDIEDERFKRIDEAHREHERRLDRLDNDNSRASHYNYDNSRYINRKTGNLEEEDNDRNG